MNKTLIKTITHKINSIQIISTEDKARYIELIEKASDKDLENLNKKLDIILEKVVKLTDKVFNKYTCLNNEPINVSRKSKESKRQAQAKNS